jgi:hypothetical protein
MRIKNYISYSQYNTILSSSKQYQKIYIDGFKLKTKYIDFGGIIANVLESRKAKGYNEETAVNLIEEKENQELELVVDFYGIPLLGKLDAYENGTIYEYKTGKNAWTQKKVDNNEQLTFYAIMVSKHFKIKVEDIKIKLIWLETIEDTDGSIMLTGRKEEFKTKRTNKDLIKIYPKVKKAWIGIEKLIDEYIK